MKSAWSCFYAKAPLHRPGEIRARHKIFLDLKDIPNRKKAMAALSALDVDMVNVHNRAMTVSLWRTDPSGWYKLYFEPSDPRRMLEMNHHRL